MQSISHTKEFNKALLLYYRRPIELETLSYWIYSGKSFKSIQISSGLAFTGLYNIYRYT